MDCTLGTSSSVKKEEEIYFTYMPKKPVNKKKLFKKIKKNDSPFNILKTVNYKYFCLPKLKEFFLKSVIIF